MTPVILIIGIDLCILSNLLYKMSRTIKMTVVSSKDHYNYGYSLTIFVLVFNFGIPWILFIFYINQYMANVFSYVFIIVNGTQVSAYIYIGVC